MSIYMASNATKQESRTHRLFPSTRWFWFGSYWWAASSCQAPPTRHLVSNKTMLSIKFKLHIYSVPHYFSINKGGRGSSTEFSYLNFSLHKKWKKLELGMHPVEREIMGKGRQLFNQRTGMLQPKDCGSDIPFISFVSPNKFLYIPKSQFPHL